jgi:hypothetical protein
VEEIKHLFSFSSSCFSFFVVEHVFFFFNTFEKTSSSVNTLYEMRSTISSLSKIACLQLFLFYKKSKTDCFELELMKILIRTCSARRFDIPFLETPSYDHINLVSNEVFFWQLIVGLSRFVFFFLSSPPLLVRFSKLSHSFLKTNA